MVLMESPHKAAAALPAFHPTCSVQDISDLPRRPP